jgi:hypothetical protein
MSGNKKLYRLLLFSVTSFVLLYGFSLLVDVGVRQSRDEGFEKVNKLAGSHIDPDIIGFGSSVGEKSFNTPYISSALGMSAYNACLDGTNFWQYKELIRYYNSYSSKKSLVLFFEAFFVFTRISAISSVERYAAHLNNKYVYGSLHNIDPGLVWKSRYVPLYKNTVVDHTYYKASIDGWKSLLSHVNDQDTMRGFVPNYSGWFADEDAVLDNMKPFHLTIDTSILPEYIHVIEELQQKGKHVIIVLPPAYKRFYTEKTDFRQLEATLDSVARVTGCTFIDFLRSAIGEDKRNFYNATHLNYNGSLLFSRQLADSLNKLDFKNN